MANTRPRLQHLRDSGAIEQDADVVMMLHRLPEDPSGETELLVSKNRNGPTGIVRLQWQAKYTRFVARSRIADEDVPRVGSAAHMQAVQAAGDDDW